MRAIVLLVATALLVLSLAAPSVSAADPSCVKKTADGVFVVVIASAGTKCHQVIVEKCHLQYYPGEPSTPVWVCDPFIRV